MLPSAGRIWRPVATGGVNHMAGGVSHMTGGVSHMAGGVSHMAAGTSYRAAGASPMSSSVSPMTGGASHMAAGSSHMAAGSSHMTAGSSHMTAGSSHMAAGTEAGTSTQQMAYGPRPHLSAGGAEWLQCAEALVGRPTSHFTLRGALDGEWRQVAQQVRQLVEQQPLLLRALRDCSGSVAQSGSARGLLVLLVSQALGRPRQHLTTNNTGRRTTSQHTDIIQSQRKLAEIAQLCHVTYLLHQLVISSSNRRLESSDTGQLDTEAFYDPPNKVALLCGDFLIAHVLQEASKFKNNKVYELVARTIYEFSKSGFVYPGSASVGARDLYQSWKDKHQHAIGSVISNHCQGALLLAGNEDEANHALVHLLGKHVGLVWQAKQELDEFIDYSATSDDCGQKLNYSSLPLLLHLQLTKGWDELPAMNEADERDLVREVRLKGFGVRGCLDVIEEHSLEAERLLREMPPNEARGLMLRMFKPSSSE